MRSALQQMLREFQATHILTLTFLEHVNLTNATAKIKKWHRRVMNRLFGDYYFQLPGKQSIEFLILPEVGMENLHFHGLIRIPPTRLAYFERYASRQWKRISIKGTFDLHPIRSTAEERDEWFSYITKGTLAKEVLHSSMLLDMDTKPALPTTHREPIRRLQVSRLRDHGGPT